MVGIAPGRVCFRQRVITLSLSVARWVRNCALGRVSRGPSGPGELRPEPLTDPDMNLSIHPDRANQRRLPPSNRLQQSPFRASIALAHSRTADEGHRQKRPILPQAIAESSSAFYDLHQAGFNQSCLRRYSLPLQITCRCRYLGCQLRLEFAADILPSSNQLPGPLRRLSQLLWSKNNQAQQSQKEHF